MKKSSQGRSLVASGLLLIVLLVAGVISTADEWPQFRGNAQLTGVSAGDVPSTLKPLWTYEAGDSIESSAASGTPSG